MASGSPSLATDVMIAGYLVDASVITLEDLAIEHIGYRPSAKRRSGGRARSPSRLPTSRSSARSITAGERADLALQLSGVLVELLKQDDCSASTTSWSSRFIPVLVEIERAGVRIDTAVLARAEAPRSRAVEPRGTRLRARRRGVQHQLAEEAIGDSLRPARHADRDDSADDEDQGAVDGIRGPRGSRSPTNSPS